MSEYQLKIQQLVDYPRCRIYRQFVQSLIQDRSIRVSGSSGLFYYTVLCSYANFRSSYRRIDGIGFTVYPGQWVCTLKELSQWFRTRFQWQALNILEYLQNRHLIEFVTLNRGKVIRYQIKGWAVHNTVLDYNCPCQKESGFFFLPVSTATELVSAERCSEMDMLLDLWISTVYNDAQVEGSGVGPVVYLRNGTGSPLITYAELAQRWGISKATVGRFLKKLEQLEYITLFTFPGRKGNAIYLKNYLSTMFQISDVLIDKEEVAMVLHISITLPECPAEEEPECAVEHEVIVSDELSSVSKSHIQSILGKLEKVLDSQGFFCFRCPNSHYMLFPLSDDGGGGHLPTDSEKTLRFGVSLVCGNGKTVRGFELTLTPTSNELRRF